MASAFVFESIAASIVIIGPLLSTGVIPVSASFRCPTVLPVVRAQIKPAHISGGKGSILHAAASIVSVSNNPNQIHYGESRAVTENVIPKADLDLGPIGPPEIKACINCQPIVQPPVHERPLAVSHLAPAQLVYRVEPVYPRMAVLAGVQGEVTLHAIMSKDGKIQSLSVTSGQPILAQAALEAVRQWRYRPYLLNGKAVEVETFITVNFRSDR